MSTLITDILTTMDARYKPPTVVGLTPEVSRSRAAWHERRLSDAHREAKLKAYAAFAALNGWKVYYSSLHPDALGAAAVSPSITNTASARREGACSITT